jgi:hypothetical protein
MRMSCNSTWLLDKETDHGVKADEVATLFDELFTDPDAKAVVFSQWLGTHEIIIRRLEDRGIGYVSFNGSVAADKRPALINRFREDPECRVFLSTDAGSTGLNLQHASTLVNMDLPWNPAILEQRIGRIHRIGQARPVRVINFVSKGTIEEGMLATLAFKRSLAAGILDGGETEIALGGSRLTRFMNDVSNVTGNIAPSEAISLAEEPQNQVATAEVDVRDTVPQEAAQPAPQVVADPWAALIQVGTQLLGAMAAPDRPDATPHPWVERDPATGARSLKIPMPPPETANLLANALSALANSLRGQA